MEEIESLRKQVSAYKKINRQFQELCITKSGRIHELEKENYKLREKIVRLEKAL